MDCSTPGFPVYYQLPELTQTHVHWVGDAIQPSLLSPPSPASESFPMSQFFATCGQSIGVSASAAVLPMNIQNWFPLRWTGWISLQSKGLSRVFSKNTVQKHGAQLSLKFNSNLHTWLLEKPQLWLDRVLLAKQCLCFLICCLGLSELFFQGASVFYFHGSSHQLQCYRVTYCFPIYLPWSYGTRCHDLSFLNVDF